VGAFFQGNDSSTSNINASGLALVNAPAADQIDSNWSNGVVLTPMASGCYLPYSTETDLPTATLVADMLVGTSRPERSSCPRKPCNKCSAMAEKAMGFRNYNGTQRRISNIQHHAKTRTGLVIDMPRLGKRPTNHITPTLPSCIQKVHRITGVPVACVFV